MQLSLIAILFFLLREAAPAISEIGVFRFLSDSSWDPDSNMAMFNINAMIVGSLFVTFGALLLSTPIALFSSFFICFYANQKLSKIYRSLIELLAGVPSVIFGLWGLEVLVPFLNDYSAPGQSLLAGALVLSVMILPTATLLTVSAFEAVPEALIKNCTALGLNTWATIKGAIIPKSSAGLISAIVLSAVRAIGETMVVLMVCGNITQFPQNIFDPVRTLTANIALEMSYAYGIHRSALFASTLWLILVVSILVLSTVIIHRPKRSCQ